MGTRNGELDPKSRKVAVGGYKKSQLATEQRNKTHLSRNGGNGSGKHRQPSEDRFQVLNHST